MRQRPFGRTGWLVSEIGFGSWAIGSAWGSVKDEEVIAAADDLLDELFPLATGSHADVTAYRVEAGALVPALADPAQFAGSAENVVLLRRNGLHVELKIDPESRVGRQHHAGVADVALVMAGAAAVSEKLAEP